jgi:hypothetical protein
VNTNNINSPRSVETAGLGHKEGSGFALTPGQACDLDGADILLPQIEADIVIADKGFDADERVIDPLEKAGKTTVIPPKVNPQTRLRQGTVASA